MNMELFNIAAQHRAWLADSQSKIAENIANASTPGYRAQRPHAFAAALEAAQAAQPAKTNARHIDLGSPAALSPSTTEEDESVDATHSGNSVDVDKEMLNAGEVRAGYALNTSVVKAFNRMQQASVKG
ncbi:MAG: flagellar basal body rod protein FlgB [Proteobacteria bacterium]|nr:flagellar basal body rod protein FlgB [Pseudomonadota bacterium]